MKTGTVLTILALTLLSASPPLRSQETGSKGRTIPIELIRNHVLIPVTIGGSEPLMMILDTGMPMEGALLIGGPRAEGLGLEYVGKGMVAGVGGGQTEADIATGVTLEIAGLEFTNQMVIVMPHDTTRSNVFEEDGVIGYSLFGRFVVRIDYAGSVLTLIPPEQFTYKGSGQVLPLSLSNNFPLLECSAELSDGSRVPLQLTVDAGASHALSLNVGSHEHIVAPGNAVESVVGRGISNSIYGKIGRVKSLELGGISMKNVLTTFLSAPEDGPSRIGRNGNLGSEILRRFVVYFDYRNERIILEPGDLFDQPFEMNMAGIAYVKTGGNLFRIDHVLENSPAGESGLKADDIVISINGRPAEQFTIGDLDALFKKEGEEVGLTILRVGKEQEVRLKLRRLI